MTFSFYLVYAKLRRCLWWQVVDNALEPFLEGGCAKIDEEADGQVHQSQIGQKLFAMNWGQFFDRLDFHDNLSLNQQVNPKSFIK